MLYSKAKLGCYPRCLLPSYVCIPGPYDEKNIFFWCQTVFIEPSSFILFSISGWGTDLDNCDVEWFALKMNGAPKYCISVSFIDCEDYSISSEGFFLLYRWLFSPSKVLIVFVQLLSHVQLLCDPMDCCPPGSSIHGISQGRILEGSPFPLQGNLPDPGIECRTPALQAFWSPSGFFTTEPPGKPKVLITEI